MIMYNENCMYSIEKAAKPVDKMGPETITESVALCKMMEEADNMGGSGEQSSKMQMGCREVDWVAGAGVTKLH